MKSIDAVTFHKQYLEHSPEHPIYRGTLEVTWKCNFSCIHCYVPLKGQSRELSLTEIKRIIDGLVVQIA